MSRSGYSDDCDHLNLYRHAVDMAIAGRRGQKFMRELVAALDALPQKRLIASALQDGGEVCALGSVGLRRGVEMDGLDPHDADHLARLFDIAPCLVREVEYMNDDEYGGDAPEQRWTLMRRWAASNLPPEGAARKEGP